MAGVVAGDNEVPAVDAAVRADGDTAACVEPVASANVETGMLSNPQSVTSPGPIVDSFPANVLPEHTQRAVPRSETVAFTSVQLMKGG